VKRHRFRSLDVWQAASALARDTYRATMTPGFRGHFALADQIRGAGTSIPANLAEGYGLGTRPQLIRFARNALGSGYELGVLLEIAHDVDVLPGATFTLLNRNALRTTSLLIGLLKGLGARVPR
jgi:four helix bundle protein